jgi:hypothetical protein
MNIKLKAILITVAVFLGGVTLIYIIAPFPAVMFLAALGGLVYFVYRGVLSQLEYNKKYKK